MTGRLLEPRCAAAVAIGLLVLAGALGATVQTSPTRGTAAPAAVSRSGTVLAQALGGIRTAAAAYIWIKLEEEHHEFYGGDLRKERSLTPLYRIATWLDPHQERSYYVGSYLLYTYKKQREAVAFAKEGLANNPNSLLLTFNVGQIYLLIQGPKARDGAIRYLTRAEMLARGADRAARLQVLAALHAAHKKWKVPGEPPEFVRELKELRAWAREESKKKKPSTEAPLLGD